MNSRFFAPVTTITLAAILAVILAVLSVMLFLSAPWLGVAFDRSYDGVGVRVAGVKAPAQVNCRQAISLSPLSVVIMTR